MLTKTLKYLPRNLPREIAARMRKNAQAKKNIKSESI